MRASFFAILVPALFSFDARANHAQTAVPGGREAEQKCELVNHHGQERWQGNTLSPFWAQEYVGAPQARAALERYSKSGGTVSPQGFGIIEQGLRADGLLGPITDRMKESLAKEEHQEDGHASCVVNLINSPNPVGVGVGRLDAFVPNYLDKSKDALGDMLKTGVRLVNISQVRHDHPWNLESMKALTKQAVVVWATGNTHSVPAHAFPGVTDLIGAGGLTPWGAVSSYSQEGPECHILAPSDHPYQMSYDGKFTGFGGTSGAGPMVAGALSNVMAILPDITAKEARTLLEKTAVPTVSNFQVPRRNGAGMLNALKLVEAAIRLKARGWPADRAKILADPAVYDFSKEAVALLADGKEAMRSPNCARRREGFQKIQSAFLLASGTLTEASRGVFDEARRLLVAHFASQGLTGNSQFYRSFDRADFAKVIEERIPHATWIQEIRSLGRALQLLDPAVARAMMERALANPNAAAAQKAAQVMGNCENAATIAAVAPALRVGYRHASRLVRLEIVHRGCLHSGAIGEEILRAALNDPDPEIRVTAAARLRGESK